MNAQSRKYNTCMVRRTRLQDISRFVSRLQNCMRQINKFTWEFHERNFPRVRHIKQMTTRCAMHIAHSYSAAIPLGNHSGTGTAHQNTVNYKSTNSKMIFTSTLFTTCGELLAPTCDIAVARVNHSERIRPSC